MAGLRGQADAKVPMPKGLQALVILLGDSVVS